MSHRKFKKAFKKLQQGKTLSCKERKVFMRTFTRTLKRAIELVISVAKC